MSSGYWGAPIRLSIAKTNPIDSSVSTADTIHQMKALAIDASRSPFISTLVNSLLINLPSHPSQTDIARDIYWWIKSHVTFVEDEQVLGSILGYEDVAQELLIPPVVLISMPSPSGDCDDFSMLAASCLLCAQIRCAFVTIAVDPETPERFSHVYVCALLDDKWMGFDTSHGQYLGWEYNGKVYRKVTWLI
jgi:hypothetical protein